MQLRDQFGYGARRIKTKLERLSSCCPSESTINRVLRQQGYPASIQEPKTFGTLDGLAKLVMGQRVDNFRTVNDGFKADIAPLLEYLSNGTRLEKRRAAAVLLLGLGGHEDHVARTLKSSKPTVARYWQRYLDQGVVSISNQTYGSLRKAQNKDVQGVIFQVLHSPPSARGFNRTTWRMKDLRHVLRESGMPTSLELIRQVVRKAGYKWRRARVMLTSRDPHYREKLGNIQHILSNIRCGERFFCVDEFGPFAIKMHPGRLLVAPNQFPKVPQYQRSRGKLILTSALELPLLR